VEVSTALALPLVQPLVQAKEVRIVTFDLALPAFLVALLLLLKLLLTETLRMQPAVLLL
jgi:hypothetical protein